LALLGYLPFAVTLMAKLGKRSRSSAKILFQEWSKAGTKMISPSNSPEDNLNRSISLSVDSLFVRQDPGALALLATLSLLPAGTSRENLRCWAPNHTSSSIATLSDAALLPTNNDGVSIDSETLFILPVIQSFMASTHRISDTVSRQVLEACCQYVFDHAHRYFDPLFEQHSEALAAEDTNIQSILFTLPSSVPSVSPDRIVQALLRFTWYRYDTRPSIEIAEHTLNRAKSLGKDRYIAEALSVLGGVYLRMRGLGGDSMAVLTEAFQLLDKQPGDRDIAQLAAECGCILARVRLSCNHPEEDIIPFVRNLQSKFGPHLDGFGRALILKEIGYFFYYLRRCSEALDSLRQAMDTFMEMERFTDAAQSMLYMAKSYFNTSELPRALESIERASSVIKRVHHHRFRALIDKCHGIILARLGNYLEALPKLERSLLSLEELGSVHNVGSVLENLGYIYGCTDNYSDASAAYKAAIEKYTCAGSKNEYIEQCEENLIRISKMQDTRLLRPRI